MGAFESCDSLESIEVSTGNRVYHSKDNCLIETATKTLIAGCKTSIIPTDDSVTSIGDYAFCGCSSLESITIPNSVTSIGNNAFYNCSSLESIIIPSVTSIGHYAFSWCSSLESVTIGNNVTIIGDAAFECCISLESITISDSVTRVGDFAFNGCSSLKIVYYKGTEQEWANISIGSYNSALTSAKRYCYSDSMPTDDGNYWHYDNNGEPVIW